MTTFRTTQVGSWPRPKDLNAENLDAKIKEVIRIQVSTGIEEITNGEYTRGIYFGGVTGLPGFSQAASRYEFSAGDLFPTPLLTGKIEYDFDRPFATSEVKAIKSALDALGAKRRIKYTIPSNSMVSFFYPNPDLPFLPPEAKAYYAKVQEGVKKEYPTYDSFIDHVTRINVNEGRAAFAAGADSVQSDGPTVNVSGAGGRGFIRQLVQLDNIVLDALRGSGTLEFHACFGNGWNTQSDTSTHYDGHLVELVELHTDILGPLEVFDGWRDYKELGKIKSVSSVIPKGLDISLGILSVKTRNVEPVGELAARYEAAVDAVGKEIIASNGCGWASGKDETIHGIEGARRKTANLVAAVNSVRRE
ncbi:MAG: hypothetical protein KGI04_02050 [Candidatus Micrarchaeota archaeon]|nr:hypothetical protein [Candidatus Micrarchaeota archaeon]